jgi:ribosomal protein L34E
MTCRIVKIPGGVSVIACGPRRPKKNEPRCHRCNAPAPYLCDFVTGTEDRGIATIKKTCDRPMCDTCRVPIAGGKDVCRPHYQEFGTIAARAAAEGKP